MNDMSTVTQSNTIAETGEPNAPKNASTPLMLEFSTFVLRVVEVLALVAAAVVMATLTIDFLPQGQIDAYFNAILIAAVFYAGLAEITGVYDVDARFSLRQAWGRVLTAWLATSIFMITVAFLSKTSEDYSRLWATSWFLVGGVSMCTTRGLATLWLLRMKRQGVFNQRVAIFGANAQGNRLAHYIRGNETLTIDLVGFYDDRPASRIGTIEPGMTLRGNLENLMAAIRSGHIDQVIIALPWSAETRLQDVVAVLSQTPIRIRLAPDLASFAFAQRPLVLLGDLPVMTLFERPISGWDQIAKRIEDLVLGTIALLIAAPVFIVIAIAIKSDSKGPIFFRQPREGFNNTNFSIWKFRSMRTEESQSDDITQATKGDSRITRVGQFIRRTSLDELPQLFNVLDGSMSLVGPRPHAASTRAGTRKFSEVVSTYAARHKVKPGMTGWAQVNGWRGETDTEDKLLRRLEHDLHYIENWSIAFDLYVLLRTIPALFSAKAY